jgi:seryl-tRNA(Sec) selenium transferase
LKTKTEEEKLAKEKKEIDIKNAQIEELERLKGGTEIQLQEKQKDLEKHKLFSDFLQSMCTTDDKDKERNTEGFTEGFTEIIDLQNRFISLKEENK